jgi:Tfp pilus assembly protein PilX
MKKSYARMKTMGKTCLFWREEGSVLVVALVFLALFTLLAVSTSSVSHMDIRIIGNENTRKVNLYAGEAAAMRGAQGMEDTDLRAGAPSYLNPINTVTDDHIRNCTFPNKEAVAELPATTAFASVSHGIAAGSSLDMTKTRVHEYAVYGWCDRNKNLVRVEVGYRKAFK